MPAGGVRAWTGVRGQIGGSAWLRSWTGTGYVDVFRLGDLRAPVCSQSNIAAAVGGAAVARYTAPTMPAARTTAVLLLSGLGLSGCGSFQAYEGPRLPAAERALIHADPAFSAGLPVQVILRKVDEREVPLNRARVEVAPGRHQLIVDCRYAATGASTRFAIAAEVEAGAAYRLEAQATGRGCEAVTLRSR